ncbi:MAG: NAD+ synthase [Promethearchaeota archaeon]|nr:MAG: NAD+ synthase [Candidatus Lokiarchaeota archaeon]
MRELDYKKLCFNIERWIADYVNSAGAENVVLGLSGGIDSAVTAALCTNAIGKNNIFAFGLPCESNPQDLSDAQLVASTLGIPFEIIELTSVYTQFLNSVEIPSNKIAKANLKPRLRMMALYYLAQSKKKSLVAGTGNRAELQIGYFTKYGDGGVDFEPLGMLYKCEVRKLAKILEIPENIITKPPSPGLWMGQTDEGEIGITYDTIDEILYRIDYGLHFNGLDRNVVEKVKKMMKLAEHKLKMPAVYELKID